MLLHLRSTTGAASLALRLHTEGEGMRGSTGDGGVGGGGSGGLAGIDISGMDDPALITRSPAQLIGWSDLFSFKSINSLLVKVCHERIFRG